MGISILPQSPNKIQLNITRQQQRAIETLKRDILLHDGLHSDSYEYKRFEVTVTPFGKVQVLSVVGRKGDEGTAAMLVRVHRHIFIGKRGGLTLVNPARHVETKDGIKRVPQKSYVTGHAVCWHPAF